MQLILLVAGLVLLLAGGDWFDSADTVGWILIGAFALITIVQVVVFATFKRSVDRSSNRLR